MLEKFRLAKAPEIARLRELEKRGALPAPSSSPRPPFAAALAGVKPLAVIAEYKRASPSAGAINPGLTPEFVAKAYAQAGAAAISVLTEETYFQGSLNFLAAMSEPGLPLLRKDFILDPLQVAATAATPASALLLIARMLTAAELAQCLELAAGFGLACVTEVFNEADLDKAGGCGASIIQVNNRDLDTLAADLAVSRRLIARKQPGQLWISASGLSKRPQLDEMAALGFDAALIGTSLMQHADPGKALTRLTGARRS
ncbi:MAG: indole-3-glycerol-phosphate synthase [Desulfovibrionaceae bacterium]|nr:indole-3-glycerol-phosphate synthase [Desulfovibrionaceae bacterium]MBF0515361.1 indole-3-glycerol-phosphate synthase [Desulfovibrionaceae bacterium]